MSSLDEPYKSTGDPSRGYKSTGDPSRGTRVPLSPRREATLKDAETYGIRTQGRSRKAIEGEIKQVKEAEQEMAGFIRRTLGQASTSQAKPASTTSSTTTSSTTSTSESRPLEKTTRSSPQRPQKQSAVMDYYVVINGAFYIQSFNVNGAPVLPPEEG